MTKACRSLFSTLLLIGLACAIPDRSGLAQQAADDKPYDTKLLRLTEILGAVHYLRELCGHSEGQTWRDQMRELLRTEGTTPIRRARLVNGFNHGYNGYSRTYRSCTDSARTAIARFMEEGALIANNLATESRKSAPPESGGNTATENPGNAGLEGGTAPAPAAR